MAKKFEINWGISETLQAQVRSEPNACKGYVIDISLGCPHQCVYCLFSKLELLVYKLKNPGYKGNVLPLKLDEILEREDFPPAVYMCYSSDPMGNEDLSKSTITILNKLMRHNVHVLFISKGIFTDALLDVIRDRPELFHVQVGIANCDDNRNKIIEPGAPRYAQRLMNLEKLADVKGLGTLSVRIDPIFPLIDDTMENIGTIINDISRLGVTEAVVGYLILTQDMREKMKSIGILKDSLTKLSEKTSTISGQELFSLPFEEKMVKLRAFNILCKEKGVKMATCACKDELLKQTELEWICHPFNRSKREEFMENDPALADKYKCDTAHLK